MLPTWVNYQRAPPTFDITPDDKLGCSPGPIIKWRNSELKYRFAMVMAFLVVINLLTPATSAQGQPSMRPEETVRRFYELYLHSLNKEEEPLEKPGGELSKFVTQRLMKSYARARKSDTGINVDFFIDAQDWDAAWEKNISVSKARIQGMRATVIVALKGGTISADNKTFDNRLKVGLRKEGGVWKIDAVNGRANVT